MRLTYKPAECCYSCSQNIFDPQENMVLLKESLSSSLEKLLSMPLSAKPDTEDTM